MIADDMAHVRDGLRRAIELGDGLEAVGEARDGLEAFRLEPNGPLKEYLLGGDFQGWSHQHDRAGYGYSLADELQRHVIGVRERRYEILDSLEEADR